MLLVTLLLGHGYAEAKIIKITKSDGGQFGYRDVEEIHDFVKNEHFLSCKYPGNENCGWTTQPPSRVSITDITSIVDDRIIGGQLSGTSSLDGVIFRWDATDVYNQVVEITED